MLFVELEYFGAYDLDNAKWVTYHFYTTLLIECQKRNNHFKYLLLVWQRIYLEINK